MRVALLKCPESSGATASTSTSTISLVAPPGAPPAIPPPLPRQQAPCSSHAHPVVQHTIQTAPMFGQPLTPQPLWVASSPFMHTLVPQPLHTTTILFPSQPYYGSCVDGSIPIHPPVQPRLCGYHHGPHVTSEQRFNAPRKADPVDGHLLVPETLSRAVLEKFTPFVQPRSPPLAGAAHTSSSDASRYEANIASTAPVASDCFTPPPIKNIPMSTGDPKPTGIDGRGNLGIQSYVVSDPRANKRCKLDPNSAATAVPSDIEHISDDETVCAASALMALTTGHNDQHPTESPEEYSINLMQAAPKLSAQSPGALYSPYQYNLARTPIVGLPPIESVLPSSRRDNFSTTTVASSESSIAASRSPSASLSTSQCISGAFRLLLDDDHAEVDHMRYSTTESQCSGTSLHRDSSSSSSEVCRSEHELATTVRLIRHDRSHTDGDVSSSDIHASLNAPRESRRETSHADHRFMTAMYNESVHCKNHSFYPLGDMTGKLSCRPTYTVIHVLLTWITLSHTHPLPLRSSSAFSLFGVGESSFQSPRSPVLCAFYVYLLLHHVFSYNITPPQFHSSYLSVSNHFHLPCSHYYILFSIFLHMA